VFIEAEFLGIAALEGLAEPQPEGEVRAPDEPGDDEQRHHQGAAGGEALPEVMEEGLQAVHAGGSGGCAWRPLANMTAASWTRLTACRTRRAR